MMFHASATALDYVVTTTTTISAYLDAVPAWVDREKIEKGQQVYKRCYMMYSLILFSSLVNGFLLARFAEVLAMSGYATDPRQARRRFGDTGA